MHHIVPNSRLKVTENFSLLFDIFDFLCDKSFFCSTNFVASKNADSLLPTRSDCNLVFSFFHRAVKEEKEKEYEINLRQRPRIIKREGLFPRWPDR